MVLWEDGTVSESTSVSHRFYTLETALRCLETCNDYSVPTFGRRYFLCRGDEIPLFQKEPKTCGS